MYSVYIIKKNSELYIGITKNIAKKIGVSNNKKGAFFTKNKTPFDLVFLEEYGTLLEARRRETQIKKWRRDKKEFLIEKYLKKQKTK